MRPFSKTQRIEFGISNAWYYQRMDVKNNYYDYNSDAYLGSDKKKLSSPAGYNLQIIDAAYVIDNSFFGMTAPMRGMRSRFGIEQYFGEFTFTTALIDLRKYWFIKPITIAARAMHYGRFGKRTNDERLNQLYLGYPWYMRGYEYQTFGENISNADTLITTNDLTGSKIGLLNFEVRIPFTGPKKIALIPSGYLMSDFVFFTDAGIAWDNNSDIRLTYKKTDIANRIPLITFGASLRINILGYMVIEPYYAFPLQYGAFNNPSFGINFMPGW